MAEYIEREALIAELGKGTLVTDDIYGMGIMTGLGRALTVARELPAADVVEVPCQCKDCKHWMDFPNCGCTDFVKVCALAEYMIGQNGFCLYGERKGGDGNG